MNPPATLESVPPSQKDLIFRSGELLFVQIADYYRKEILRGAYPEGAHLPTCSQAGKMFGVSAQTVDRAFNLLAKEGLVFRRRSLGTIVQRGEKRRSRSRRSTRLIKPPICQVLRVSTVPNEEQDLILDYQNGLVEGFDAWKHRFEVIYIRDDRSDLEMIKSLVEERQISGIVALGFREDVEEYLTDSRFPTVFINRNCSEKGATSVMADAIGGYRDAWKYVDGLGHRTAAFFGLESTNFETRHRECVSGRVLADAHCELSFRICAEEERIWESLAESLGTWDQDRKNWPTVFFAQTDVIATKLIRVLREHHIRVPDDVSVIGFNDAQIAGLWDPGLTTLKKPRYQMALAAARLLLDLLNGRDSAKAALQVFPVHLVSRESCRQPGIR